MCDVCVCARSVSCYIEEVNVFTLRHQIAVALWLQLIHLCWINVSLIYNIVFRVRDNLRC